MSTGNKSYRVVAPDRHLRVPEGEVAVTVRHEGEIFARSERALRLLEGGREAVLYLPRSDVDASRLVASEHRYRCRWKGEARYFHVDLRDRTLEDVIWGYPDAPEDIAVLRDRIAFDPAVFDVRIDGADEKSGEIRVEDSANVSANVPGEMSGVGAPGERADDVGRTPTRELRPS